MRSRSFKIGAGQRAGLNLQNDENRQLEKPTTYFFLSGIVVDVISNPYEYLNVKTDVDNNFKVSDVLKGIPDLPEPLRNKRVHNDQLVDIMPMNSIIANIIDTREGLDGGKPYICYPFFPPHLSLPLKPGEYVWILGTDVKGSGRKLYWMCRKVGALQVDDLNYTHMERSPVISRVVDSFIANKRARSADIADLEESTSLNNLKDSKGKNQGNLRQSFEDLFINSYAFRKEFSGEPVPRLAKNCGDLLLQGSNNAGLQLTTEKFTTTENLRLKDSAGLNTSAPSEIGTNKALSPAIDIFVQRKRTDISGLRNNDSEKTKSINTVRNTTNGKDKFFNFSENDKLANVRQKDDSTFNKEVIDELSDGLDVGARLYMSNRCDVDNVFGSNFDMLSGEEQFGPCIISYAHHNRLVAEKDVVIASRTGSSFAKFYEDGKIKINAGSGNTIELTSRNTTPGEAELEPYIRYSELQSLLADIAADIAGVNSTITVLGTLIDTILSIPPITAAKSAYEASKQTANAALQAAGATSLFANGSKINAANIATELSPAGRIGSGNGELARGSIASSKIFGE
tara:strand:- start:1096 stop:2805 length:1710 start_codon:yes stop_codon:yes gene_type:complete